jgi:hypothetical protein
VELVPVDAAEHDLKTSPPISERCESCSKVGLYTINKTEFIRCVVPFVETLLEIGGLKDQFNLGVANYLPGCDNCANPGGFISISFQLYNIASSEYRIGHISEKSWTSMLLQEDFNISINKIIPNKRQWERDAAYLYPVCDAPFEVTGIYGWKS